MQFILLRLAPILSKRSSWRVGQLKEFYPRRAGLLGLNVNKGQEICIRFRIPGQQQQFLPFHEVLCTSLHELAHCEVSRHDNSFWRLYYVLMKECEQLEVQLLQQGRQLYPDTVLKYNNSPTDVEGPTKKVSRTPAGRVHSKKPGLLRSTGDLRQAITAENGVISFHGVGHRLGGDSPIPHSPEALRSLRERTLLRRYIESRGPSWFETHTPDDIPCDPSPSGVASLPSVEPVKGWKCDKCGFWNSDTFGLCDVCSDDIAPLPSDPTSDENKDGDTVVGSTSSSSHLSLSGAHPLIARKGQREQSDADDTSEEGNEDMGGDESDGVDGRRAHNEKKTRRMELPMSTSISGLSSSLVIPVVENGTGIHGSAGLNRVVEDEEGSKDSRLGHDPSVPIIIDD